jgi:DnaJ-class molecular chaperone
VSMAFPNNYKGDCKTCGTFVPAGEGIYEQGMITCTETIGVTEGSMMTMWVCLPAYNAKFNTNHTTVEDAWEEKIAKRDQATAIGQQEILEGLINGGLEDYAVKANVRSLAQVISKVTGAEIAIADLDFGQATDVRNELQKRIERKNTSKALDGFKSTNTCNRCGGAGSSDRWKHTGSVCYKCGGSGKYHN